MYCVLLSVIFLMCPVAVVKSVGSRTRYYENRTSVTCLGIVCPLDEIFVPCTHSLGDGKMDTCEPCPSDRPRTLSTFDSSAFEDPPVYFVCKSVLERCECAEEAELVNPLNCNKTLEPICKCNIAAGYYGKDPKACRLSENEQCRLPGFELKQDGSCEECPRDTYKNTYQFGRCLPQPRCRRPLVVDDPGDSAHRRICKLPLTTPPPDRRSTSRESTSATDINNSTLSYSTSNVTSSTNQTNPLLDSTNSEWIYIVLSAVVLLIVSVFICVCCFNRRKKRQNKNRRQNKRHQNNEDGDILIANGKTNSKPLQSINRYQQGNGGNTHTSSCVIDKLKRKICPKRCVSSKGYEHIKTTTMNEEKNTMNGDQTAAKVNGNKTSNIVNVDEIKGKVNSNDITVKGNSGEIADNVNGDKTAEGMNGEETAAKVNDDKTTEGMNGEETAAKVNGDKTTERMNGEETAAEVNGDKMTERMNGEETAAKVNGDKMAEGMNGEETAAKVNGDKTAEGMNGEETAAKVNGDKTTEGMNGEETAAKVNGDKTAEGMNGEETTEIENCENTTTTADATENHDTSYDSLDVNSFFSSGKTSSGFVDDMYILKWSPRDDSSSKGFIECTDPSGNQFKSMTINNGSQGMILLKMKEITKRCNFIFVSSSENCQTESFVQIIVEPVTKNLDLSTLLKSGLSTLDFRSFEVVQNRPEEDLSFQRYQNGSLDQPHQMSLPHSQYQADSGISDTTPAECGNQAGNSIPRLSLSSLNQDFDNDEN